MVILVPSKIIAGLDGMLTSDIYKTRPETNFLSSYEADIDIGDIFPFYCQRLIGWEIFKDASALL